MKRITTIVLMMFFVCFNISAQTTETVSMGPNYANEVFWKMQGGQTGEAAVNSWELAFRLGIQTSSIFINSANSVSLYQVPNTDTSGWSTLDTTGLQTWHQLFNSDTSWEYGAFDRSSTGFPDFSWGDYDFTSHVVTGDSLYVIKLGGSVYKKLWIVKKDFGNWTFRYANLDNTGDQVVTLNNADYTDKNFAYYSITNGSSLNLEPNTSDWDVLFTRYLTLLPPDNTPYLVTGVLNNVGVTVAEANGVDVQSVDPADYENFYVSSISEIGYDWKYFDMNLNQFAVVADLCYFVKSLDGNVYKIVFTGFEGAATGNISWEQSSAITSIHSINSDLNSAMVYPNPVSDKLNLVFDLKKNSSNLKIALFNLDGKEVFHAATSANAGLNQQQFLMPELSNGLYLLKLDDGGSVINLKVIINR